jgi:hypothetical protein
MMAMVPRTVRKTMAWYWVRLGAGRLAGLQSAHTDRPSDTWAPHRTQRSDSRSMAESLLHLSEPCAPAMTGTR